MKIKAYKRFLKAYHNLPENVQKKVGKQIALLSKDFKHPSLHTKKIKGRNEGDVHKYISNSAHFEGKRDVHKYINNSAHFSPRSKIRRQCGGPWLNKIKIRFNPDGILPESCTRYRSEALKPLCLKRSWSDFDPQA